MDEKIHILLIEANALDARLVKGQVTSGQLRRTLRFAIERCRLSGELLAEIRQHSRAQQALQLSEKRYRLRSETAPVGILLADEWGKHIDANTKALRMFGYNREELIGGTAEMLLTGPPGSSLQGYQSAQTKESQAQTAAMGKERVTRRITALRPEVKVIFTSGYANDAIVRQGVLDPAVAFLQKPHRPKALERKIREVLAKRARETDHHALSALEIPPTRTANPGPLDGNYDKRPSEGPC
ncbi:MAG TPA: PAS domain S-box protein [Candidatus Acidoferrum sp.]|nr:PAS domain S-box protein [Candidatus Acidoferrum sp.]